MEYVNGELFYHFQRAGSQINWSAGDKYSFGSEKNNYITYYETIGKLVESPITGGMA
ncbi:hypothetical protein [Paenibacillus lutimineralis]|uniref:hypothetical protein n=1 Tax=Paenibacillus lutimineralis TaxID=2707005 RepID=UPI0013A64D4D|nr:hypothetical protein [Paenibacillus lutimineralis]